MARPVKAKFASLKECKTYLERLRFLREEEKMTQAEIAFKIDEPEATYKSYESGKRKIPDVVFNKLFKLFDVTPNFIFGMTEKRGASVENSYIADELGFMDKATVSAIKRLSKLIPLETIDDKVVLWDIPAHEHEDHDLYVERARSLEEKGYYEIEPNVFSRCAEEEEVSPYIETIEYIINNFDIMDGLARYIFHKNPCGDSPALKKSRYPVVLHMEHIKSELDALRRANARKDEK